MWQFLVLDTTNQELSLLSAHQTARTITDSYRISSDDYRHLGAHFGRLNYSTIVALSRLGGDEFNRRFPDLATALQVPSELRPYRVAPRVSRQAAQFCAFIYRQSINDDLEKRIRMLRNMDSIGSLVHLQHMAGIPDGMTDLDSQIRIFIVGSSIGATGSVLMFDVLELIREAHRTVCGTDCHPSLVVFPSDAFGSPAVSGHFHSAELENEGVFLSRLEALHQYDVPTDKRPYDIYFVPRDSSASRSGGREAIAVASEFIASVTMSPWTTFDHFRVDWESKRTFWPQNPPTVVVSSFGFVKLAIGRRYLATYLKELLIRRLVETSENWAPSVVGKLLTSELNELDHSLGGRQDHFTMAPTNLSAPIPKRLLPLEHEYLLEGPELWPGLARMLLEQSCTQPVTTTARLLDAVSREIIEGGFPISNQPADIASPLEFTRLLSLDVLDRQVQSWLMRPGSVTQRYLREGLRSYLHGDQSLGPISPSRSRDVLETRKRTFREKLQQALEFARADEHYWRTRVHPETEPRFIRWMSSLPQALPPEIMNFIIDHWEFAYPISERDSDAESISLYGILNTLATPRPPFSIRKI